MFLFFVCAIVLFDIAKGLILEKHMSPSRSPSPSPPSLSMPNVMAKRSISASAWGGDHNNAAPLHPQETASSKRSFSHRRVAGKKQKRNGHVPSPVTEDGETPKRRLRRRTDVVTEEDTSSARRLLRVSNSSSIKV